MSTSTESPQAAAGSALLTVVDDWRDEQAPQRLIDALEAAGYALVHKDESVLCERDRVRIWRAFGAMPYAGGIRFFHRRDARAALSVDQLLDALEELAARLRAAADTSRANEVELLELHGDLAAVGRLLKRASS